MVLISATGSTPITTTFSLVSQRQAIVYNAQLSILQVLSLYSCPLQSILHFWLSPPWSSSSKKKKRRKNWLKNVVLTFFSFTLIISTSLFWSILPLYIPSWVLRVWASEALSNQREKERGVSVHRDYSLFYNCIIILCIYIKQKPLKFILKLERERVRVTHTGWPVYKAVYR